MESGVHFIDFLPGDPATLGPTLAAAAKAAEQGGATLFTLADHFFQMEGLGRAQDPFLEGFTSLGFLAGQTTKIELSLLVAGVTYRYPGVLAKAVTTLDVLSGGRSMFGIGAAWYEREHTALGIPYPPLRTRFEMLEEMLQICRQMWSDEDGPYEGRHYQLAETICEPRPIQQPRPRILVGGGGERKTLRLVGRYADACNLFAPEPAVVAHKLEVLAGHCEDAGRDPATVEKTILAVRHDPLADADAFVAAMDQYARLGVELVEVTPRGPDPLAFVTRLGEEIVPRLTALGPS